MIGLVMAGGKGTRMGLSEEKLLLKYKKPVIFHVIDALNNSGCFSKIMVATSSNSPNTVQVLEQKGIETLGTPPHDNIECAYTGISIIDAKKIKKCDSIIENHIILNDKRIAFNLNTKKDYELLNAA
jgi:adenosylcobinamide-phosphate guanylyltransferase